MKRPHQGIHSTRPRNPIQPPAQRVPLPILHAAPIDTNPAYVGNDSSSTTDSSASEHSGPQPTNNTIIEDDGSSYAGNFFCFGAFANRQTGVVYSDSTVNFPYMSLAGNVCFFGESAETAA